MASTIDADDEAVTEASDMFKSWFDVVAVVALAMFVVNDTNDHRRSASTNANFATETDDDAQLSSATEETNHGRSSNATDTRSNRDTRADDSDAVENT